jgi:hypothetical protein
MMDMGRVIPQGPTVQSTPATTNSLADVAALLLPALVGSQMKHYTPNGVEKGGMLGALQGAGMGAEALDQQRVRAQKFAEAQQEADYRKQLERHAELESERAEIDNSELQKKIANRDKTLDEITDPDERRLFLYDPETWMKQKAAAKALPGQIGFIAKASKGALTPDLLSTLPSDSVHSLFDDAAKATMSNKVWQVIQARAGDLNPALTGEDADAPIFAQVTPDGLKPLPIGSGSQAGKTAGPPPKKSDKEKQISDSTMSKLDEAREVALNGQQALKLYDKVLEKPWLTQKMNLAGAMSGVGSMDPDVTEFVTTLQGVTNTLAHQRFGARLTQTEIARLSKEVPTLKDAAVNSTAFKKALETSMEIYSKGMSRRLKDLEDEGYKIPDTLSSVFPMRKDDPYVDRAAYNEQVKKESAAPRDTEAPKGGVADPGIAQKIQAAKASGHSDAEIAAYLKSKLGADPAAYGL